MSRVEDLAEVVARDPLEHKAMQSTESPRERPEDSTESEGSNEPQPERITRRQLRAIRKASSPAETVNRLIREGRISVDKRFTETPYQDIAHKRAELRKRRAKNKRAKRSRRGNR